MPENTKSTTVQPASAYGWHGPAATRWLLLVLMMTGIVLRIWQYAGGASLWMDEIALARNIVDRPMPTLLLEPLDYAQVAPQGFLLAEKIIVSVFGPSDFALRLFPLLCALASIVLFRRVAERMLPAGAAVLAVALFALGLPFISYSAQVKQYSSDVAATLLLLLIALELRGVVSRRRALIVGVLGVLVVWFSQTAVLVLAGLGAGLATRAWIERDRRSLRPLVSTLLLWAAGSAATILAGLWSMTPQTRAYMNRFWEPGFMPMPPRSAEDALWLWNQLLAVFGPGSLRYVWPALYVALTIVGLWSLWRRRRDPALLMLGPLGVAVAAGVAHQYPFSGRLIVFLLPLFLLAVAEAAGWLGRRFPVRLVPAGTAVCLTLVALPAIYILIQRHPVYRLQETKPMLAYLQEHRLPGDAVYVYYGAWQAAGFYGPHYGLDAGEYMLGGCHRGDTRSYLEELDHFRGHPRLWVLFSHALPMFREHEEIVRYLDTIGVRRELDANFTDTLGGPDSGVYIYLYDLSHEARLDSVTAAKFDIEAPSVQPAQFGCVEGPQVPRPSSSLLVTR